MGNDSKIKEVVKKHFDFLCSDFGAKIEKQESDSFGVFLTYTTEKAGIRVSFEPRDGGIFVMVFPLRQQEIPNYRDWYDVRDLFQAKGVEFTERNITDLEKPDQIELEEAVKHFANNTRVYANSFLRGNFAIIDDMKRIVANRMTVMGQTE